MRSVKIRIIDGRHINIGCSLETYVNDELQTLAEDPANSNIKLSYIDTDYFVFQYVHDTALEIDVPP